MLFNTRNLLFDDNKPHTASFIYSLTGSVQLTGSGNWYFRHPVYKQYLLYNIIESYCLSTLPKAVVLSNTFWNKKD